MTIANLQEEAINRIKSNVSIPDGGGVLPISVASQEFFIEPTFSRFNPRVSVSAERVSTNRINQVQETVASVRVVIDATDTFVEKNGTLRLTELQDDIVDELKNHSGEYTADGVETETSVEYEESIQRYMTVTEFRFRNYRELNQS